MVLPLDEILKAHFNDVSKATLRTQLGSGLFGQTVLDHTQRSVEGAKRAISDVKAARMRDQAVGETLKAKK